MRARGIKPGFFRNEYLADLPFEYRLLFAGLWCCADRAGRMEDRPRRIKADVFPYDDVDVACALNGLQSAGVILRYTAAGHRYIQVLRFVEHQTPHIKEAPSTIPAPDEYQTNTMLAPPDSLTPDSLTPDSLTPDSLTPDSLTPDKGSRARTQAEAVVAIYHELCPYLPHVSELTDTRKRQSLALLKRCGGESGIREYFARVAASDFLMGRKITGREWRASFDWLVKPEHVPKIIEGTYDNRDGAGAIPAMGVNTARAVALAQRYEEEDRNGQG